MCNFNGQSHYIALLTVSLFFFSIPSFSQSNFCTIEGKILTEEGISLPFSQILSLSPKDSILNDYSIADGDGNYQLNIACDEEVLLKVRSLNFKEKCFIISTTKDTLINFHLEEDPLLLEEIEVKGERPIELKGDTTTFNVSYFSDNTEEKVEDLLSKIPGFKVNSNGDVEFQGELIDKILLDGDDLVGENYKILSKNLSADLISKIDVVKNFTDEKMFRGISRTDEIAVNLQIKEDRKSTLFGTVSSKTDFINNYSGFSNLLSYTDKMKLVFLGQANTIGENPDEYENNSIETDDQYSLTPFFLPLSTTQDSKILEEKYYNENESQYTSISLIRDIGSFELKNQFSFNNINNQINDQFNTNYFDQNEQIIRSRNNDLNARLLRNTFRGLFAKKKFEIEFIVNSLFDKRALDSEEIINQDGLQSNLKEGNLESVYSLKFSRKLTDKSAFLTQLYYKNKDNEQEYLNTENLLFTNYNNGLSQDFFSNREEFYITNKYVKRYKKYNISFDLNANHIQGSASKKIDLGDSIFSENISLKERSLDLIPTFKYQLGESLLGVSPSLTLLDVNLNRITKKMIIPNPSLFLNIKLTTKKKINLVLAHNTSIADILLSSETPTIKDANILYFNGLSNIEVLKNNSLLVSFYSQDFNSLSSYYFSLIWSKELKSIRTNYTINEDQILLSQRPGSGSEIISIATGFDKYLDFLNSTLSMNSSVTNTYVPLFIDNQLSASTNYIASNKISIVNTSPKIFRFNASFSDNRSWSDFTSSSDFALFQKFIVGTQFFPSGGILLGLSNHWYFSKNSSSSSFLNFKGSWEISKKLSIGLEGINILNNKVFTIRNVNNQFEVLEITNTRTSLWLFKAEIDF
ncbi:hypothetical protein [Ekhidna sp.]|jgi:hypothetical protein|uniref:hypothetical protein n=1 Tax=Ekhidna sp. TaxID=2608089 RepID=UPI0032ECCA38